MYELVAFWENYCRFEVIYQTSEWQWFLFNFYTVISMQQRYSIV